MNSSTVRRVGVLAALFSGFFTRKPQARKGARRRMSVAAEVEILEQRTLLCAPAPVEEAPVAFVVNDHIWPQEVAGGDSVVFAEFRIAAEQGTPVMALSVKVDDATKAAVRTWNIFADFRGASGVWGKEDGVHETWIAVAGETPSGLSASVEWRGGQLTTYGSSLQIVGTIEPGAAAGEIGIDGIEIGGWSPYSHPSQTVRSIERGAGYPRHTVVGEDAQAVRMTVSGISMEDEDVRFGDTVATNRFVVAAEGDDLLIDHIGFTVDRGSFSDGRNYGLFADLDRNGSYETRYATGMPTRSGGIEFDLYGEGTVVTDGDAMEFEVRVDMAVSEGKFSLSIDPGSVRGTLDTLEPLQPDQTIVIQPQHTRVITVVPMEETITLHLGIDGPSDGIVTPDANDVVFGRLTVDTTAPVDVQRMYIAVEATDDAGNRYDAGQLIEDLELRNTRTGRVVEASTHFLSGPHFYVVSGFIFEDGDVWEIRADMEGAVDGQKLRAFVFSTDDPNRDLDIGGSNYVGYTIQAEGLNGEDVEIPIDTALLSNRITVLEPQLNVAVQRIGTSDIAVSNEKNINLLRFEAKASEAADLLLHEAVFQAEMGSLLNGINYSFWVDTDGNGSADTVLQKGVAAGGLNRATVTFDTFIGGGFVIPAGDTVTFEVRMDVASWASGTLQMGLVSVAAETMDNGASLEAYQIHITAAPSKVLYFISNGNLYVSKDSSPVPSRQVLAGALSEPLARLQLRAQYEDIDVTDLQITVEGDGASSIDRFELYKDSATTPFATATVGAAGSDKVPEGGVTFAANLENGQLIVPDGQSVDVVIRARLKTDDTGAKPGSTFRLRIDGKAVSNNATGEGAVRARGASSSNNLIANDEDLQPEGEVFLGRDDVGPNASIYSNWHTVVGAKITSIANASQDEDGTALLTGVSTIGQFRFTAASNWNTSNGTNDATLDGLIVTVNAVHVALTDSFRLFNLADPSVKVIGRVVDRFGNLITTGNVTGVFYVVFQGLSGSGMESRIDAGDTLTFGIEADVTDANTGMTNASLQVWLDSFATPAQVFGVTASHIVWLDDDAGTDTLMYWVESDDTIVQSTLYRG